MSRVSPFIRSLIPQEISDKTDSIALLSFLESKYSQPSFYRRSLLFRQLIDLRPYDYSSRSISQFLDDAYQLYLALNAAFPPDEVFLPEPFFCQIIFTALGVSYNPLLFTLSQWYTKASDWTYNAVSDAILGESRTRHDGRGRSLGR
jgi:hypothetical protein